jgi:N6-adenosine-specific RNA methylase IME4
MTALPTGPYQLILADPAWKFASWNGVSAVPTQAADPYPTMTVEEMAALPVQAIAAKHSLLAMWTIGSHLDVAHDLAAGWGFDTFVTDLFYWAKQRLADADQVDLFTDDIPEPKIGMGRHSRKQVEPCYLFARGRGLPVQAHDVRQLIIAPPTVHSRKPAEQYTRLERLYGDVRRLELFARNTREGWDSWGNEVGKFGEVTA